MGKPRSGGKGSGGGGKRGPPGGGYNSWARADGDDNWRGAGSSNSYGSGGGAAYDYEGENNRGSGYNSSNGRRNSGAHSGYREAAYDGGYPKQADQGAGSSGAGERPRLNLLPKGTSRQEDESLPADQRSEAEVRRPEQHEEEQPRPSPSENGNHRHRDVAHDRCPDSGPSDAPQQTEKRQELDPPKPASNFNFGCQDIRYASPEELSAFEQRKPQNAQQQKNSKSKAKSGGGRNNRGGGAGGGGGNTGGGGGGGGGNGGGGCGGGGGGGGGEGCADKKASKQGGGRKGGGGGGGGGGGAEGDNNNAAQKLSSKIRKMCTTYEETYDVAELVKAYETLEASVSAEEGCCDSATLQLLLISLTRRSQLSKAHKVIDLAATSKVYLDVPGIIAISLAVCQRSQSHRALRYLRRLVYECLPPDFGIPNVQFFDRHASFIFSELMAEADGCFGRMENRDPSALVSGGHAEVDVLMDWDNSSATNLSLYNREDKGKKVYIPTIQHQGFQRYDSALLSFDISYPEVAEKVPREYDRIGDGAEVEIVGPNLAPNQTAALAVRLTSPPKIPFKPGMAYRMDRLASRDQTRRMMDALKIILQNRDKGEKSSLQPSEHLRELLLVPIDTTLSKANKVNLPVETMDFGGDQAKMQGLEDFHREARDRYVSSLNASQFQALFMACTQRITLIQGPPGTGKTTTAVQIVSAMVQYNLVDLPLLVTADSNAAVDNLVRGIGKHGLHVVRVGRPESIRDDVKQYALDGRWKDLKKAEVVCATCIGVSATTLDKVRFGTVLIDECTQAAESAALVPIARGCQQVILIGDQCQLPPTVLSDHAENEGLGESLFTRLVTQGVRPVLLDTQYRMHPLICEFASAAFYNGRLKTGISHSHRKPPDGFPWPQRQMPVAFINLERSEEKRDGSSYINQQEADKALWALQEVCRSEELGPDDVGIVTPYKGQVNLIKRIIRERLSLQRFRTGLEVESVDGFQGQEKEVIIFCAVRNNREGKVGFLSDWRRLNVMLTRAKRGCIVIGSRLTLVSDPLWQQWLLWAAARGAICGESPKGKWVPKYLVDDRDGMWTVKASIIEDASQATIVVPMDSQINGPAPVLKEEPEEVLDSWEDLGSPTNGPASPLASPQELQEGALGENVDESAIDNLDTSSASMPRAAEEEGKSSSQRPYLGPDDDREEDTMRCSGTPKPTRSPARQFALANMGLLDDLDLDEQATGPAI